MNSRWDESQLWRPKSIKRDQSVMTNGWPTIYWNEKKHIEAYISWDYLRVFLERNSQANDMAKIIAIAAKSFFSWALILWHGQNSVDVWLHWAGARLQWHVSLPKMERVVHSAFRYLVWVALILLLRLSHTASTPHSHHIFPVYTTRASWRRRGAASP
jgi:hypothetical protein